MWGKNDLRVVRKYYTLFNLLIKINEDSIKNNLPNSYSKRFLNIQISLAFGIFDPRSVKAIIVFAISNKFLIAGTTGYGIKQTLKKDYEEFREKYFDIIMEFEE